MQKHEQPFEEDKAARDREQHAWACLYSCARKRSYAPWIDKAGS